MGRRGNYIFWEALECTETFWIWNGKLPAHPNLNQSEASCSWLSRVTPFTSWVTFTSRSCAVGSREGFMQEAGNVQLICSDQSASLWRGRCSRERQETCQWTGDSVDSYPFLSILPLVQYLVLFHLDGWDKSTPGSPESLEADSLFTNSGYIYWVSTMFQLVWDTEYSSEQNGKMTWPRHDTLRGGGQRNN